MKRGNQTMGQKLPGDIHIAEKLAEKMIVAANRHEMSCRDDKCFLVYALIRDCGYQVKKVLGTRLKPNRRNTG